jgi:hypothetical protein
MATAEITVTAEKSVHDALRQLAQAIWDKHGVSVQSVRFSWIDASSAAQDRLIVTEVTAETLTKA